MKNISTAEGDLQVVLGGIEIEVAFHDKEETEMVKVRQIPLRHMQEYAGAFGDEGRLLEIFTRKPPEWVDSLTQESQERIVEIGDKLNLDPFLRWSERRLAATKQIEPLTGKALALQKSVPPSAPGAALPSSS